MTGCCTRTNLSVVAICDHNTNEGALEAAAPATSVGLRVTSYLASGQAGGEIKLVIAGEASRMQPGPATLQLVVRDLEGRKVVAGEQRLGEAAGHVAGGVASVLTRAGIGDERAASMQRAIKGGAVLLAVHVLRGDVQTVRAALEASGASDVELATWE